MKLHQQDLDNLLLSAQDNLKSQKKTPKERSGLRQICWLGSYPPQSFCGATNKNQLVSSGRGTANMRKEPAPRSTPKKGIKGNKAINAPISAYDIVEGVIERVMTTATRVNKPGRLGTLRETNRMSGDRARNFLAEHGAKHPTLRRRPQ